MIKKLLQAAMVMAAGLALGGCPFEQASTTAPASRPPAGDYQQALPASTPPANIRTVCYNAADLAVYRARMLQQQLSVGTLQCQNKNGSRAYEREYTAFIAKYQAELAANTRSLTQLAGRKRFNVDVVVTEFANRSAQRAPVDKEFCSRTKRAFDWLLSAQVTTLAQAPPMYDLGPEMNVHPCPAP
jgi:hypothetical protein